MCRYDPGLRFQHGKSFAAVADIPRWGGREIAEWNLVDAECPCWYCSCLPLPDGVVPDIQPLRQGYLPFFPISLK